VPRGDAAFLKKIKDGLLKFEKPDSIGDRGAVLAGTFGNLLLGKLELVDHPLKSSRLFHGVEILALKVLDQRHLKRHSLGHIADYDGDATQGGSLSGSPSSLTSDQLIAIGGPAHDEGLDNAA
jgi:hypothetical protein